ncbi:MAG: glycosyltransferase family 4 protein [Deltaproteobacteria bacterium]|uniref:glycosyltransferase family 4 protein n=1 Tax=Desulfobacula sp. TaxID=2593537 RepID=UPI00198C53F4|nr:glycosyltransferase family 4 protein [Candidatus Desulfobacula maris]MBL6992776.1 glycosyltransferase family 4 protein [Desulfobacula sp.]
MKTKLMQITHDLAIGGLQQVVVNLCRSIDRDKFDVSVLCLRSLGEFVPEVEKLGIKVHYLPQKKNGTDYCSFLKVAKILRQEKIEVIHTHNTQPFIDGTIGALLSCVKKIVHTDHARDFPDKFRYMLAEHVMSYFAYRVVGVSEHTSENLINYEKISSKKIMTIENGIDGSRFEVDIDQQKKRKELGIRSKGPVIGLGVRLAKQKGITYLLQAMPQVVNAYPDITLIIVGDGELKTELQAEAKQLGINNNVLFLGARLDIPELLKLFDVYVLPSLWEGMPMVLLEAMAAGCPVVATDVGGVSKVIDSKQNGLLVAPQEPEQLAGAVIQLLTDEQLQKKYAEKALQKFKKKFSAEIMTKQYEHLYLRT